MEQLMTVGGVCHTRDLTRADWGQTDIRRAVRDGRLSRLRTGWYSQEGADDKVVRAVRAGGSLACASALAFHGAWDVTASGLHVRRDHNHTGPLPSGMVLCRSSDPADDRAPDCPVDAIDVALRCAWRCLEQDDFIVCCDSLLHKGLMDMAGLRHALGSLRGRDDTLNRCDQAEAGTETLTRLRLRAWRASVRPQVTIPGVGRVDLLVGERLVVEVDSRAHHTGEERYRADRERDLKLMAMGYVVVRLTYEQVMFDWATTAPWLREVVNRFGR